MEVNNKYFIIQKHIKRKGKLARRRFNEPERLDEMIALAKKYAEESGEDFLIAMVVTEVSKPDAKKEG